MDWTKFDNQAGVEEKWITFKEIYNDGVNTYVPRLKIKDKYKEEWFNRKCEEARDKRDRMWKIWRKD